MTDRHAILRLLAVVLTAAAAGAPSPANADLYRCTAPDGRVIFTDNRATCPGSEKYEPKGKLQSIATEESLPPAPPAQGRLEMETIRARAEASLHGLLGDEGVAELRSRLQVQRGGAF